MSPKAEWPPVTIIVCTYNRPTEIRKTIQALCQRLHYPDLRWIIADDGSPGSYVTEVTHWMIDALAVNPDLIECTITERKGWGANVNAALAAAQTEYIYFTEDDYVLLRPLDLRPYVALMECDTWVGLVRLGIVGHAGIVATLLESDISAWLPGYQENDSNRGYEGNGRLGYWRISPELSAGPFGFYIYSNRPHLKHVRFHDEYGWYREGAKLADTEHAMNHAIRDVRSRYLSAGHGPVGFQYQEIVCPANWVLWHFDHIGKSRQDSEYDKAW